MPVLGGSNEQKIKVNCWYSLLHKGEKEIVQKFFLTSGRKDKTRVHFYPGKCSLYTLENSIVDMSFT